MHVLRQLHRTLRPDGVLLDLHPQPEHPRVVIVRAGRPTSIGSLDSSQDQLEIRQARRRLVRVQRDGLFRTEQRLIFTMRRYHDSVEAWLEDRRDRSATSIIPTEVMRAARREMRTEGTKLGVVFRVRASAFRRVDRPT